MNTLKPIVQFLLLLTLMGFQACSQRPEIIAIQPLGKCKQTDLQAVQQALTENYQARVYILPQKALPAQAYVNIKTPRYRADSLLLFLKNHKPDSVDFILGITGSDISTTKKDNKGNVKQPISRYTDWGIFGLGYRPGVACVISTFRLKHPELPRYIYRLKKIATHEIGHNMGLPHCPKTGCVMEDAAETIKTIDRVNFTLCENCQKCINRYRPAP